MEILILLFLIVLNGLFAMSEIAIVSSRKVRLQQWADDGIENAGVALNLANHPSHFLSAIQIGITMVGVLSGAFGEAMIANKLEGQIATIPLLAPYSNGIALGIVVICITYLSLIIGELVPKRLALHNPERIASIVARPMYYLAKIMHPMVRFLSISTELVLKLLGSRPSQEPPVTEEEINVLMEQGKEAGVFEEAEQELVSNIFELADRPIGAIMVPRIDVFYLDIEDSFEENKKKIVDSVYSRIPVCRGGVENILGILHAKDLLTQSLSNQPMDLLALLHKPLYIPETLSVMQLLENFKKMRVHIALVVDEYGDFMGLVTLNDVMEAIVGDIPTNDISEESEAVRREDGSWLLSGSLALDKFKEIFEIDELPEEELDNYHTIGGFIMTQLGRIPNVADYFEWSGLRFEIVDMDKNRIDKVLVADLKTEEQDEAD